MNQPSAARVGKEHAGGALEMQKRIAIALLAIGALLRAVQYAANTSFWLDEIAIALNVVSRPLSQLVSAPLDLAQVAPAGFLALEKLATAALGPSELAFRLYAFVCGLLFLLLFWRLSMRVLGGRPALIALALFAVGAPLVRYSAEAKQYGGDVTAAIALTLVTLSLLEEERSASRCLAAGLFGAGVPFFSHVSMLAMAALGTVLLGRWVVERNARTAKPAALTVPIWAVGSLCAAVSAERSMSPETRQFMQSFWSRTGFPPVPFHASATLAWIADRVQNFFAFEQLLHYPFAVLYALALCGGLAVLWRRRSPWVALAVYAPLFVGIAAAVARKYPLESRLCLYLLPGVVLGVAAAIEALAVIAARLRPRLAWAVVAVALGPPAYAIIRHPPPYDVETYRDAFVYFAAHRRPGDRVFVFRSMALAALWYGRLNGLEAGEYVLGSCHKDDPRVYVADIDAFRGHPRVWVLTSAVTPLRSSQRNVARYLDAIGTRLEGAVFPAAFYGPATAELYDLSDATRLQLATAATLPVEPMSAFRPGCTGPLGPASYLRRPR